MYSGLPGIVDRMNGLPTGTYEYKVDGEPVTNTQAPTITTRENISPDALQEVAVQTSSFNAEYGAVSIYAFQYDPQVGHEPSFTARCTTTWPTTISTPEMPSAT